MTNRKRNRLCLIECSLLHDSVAQNVHSFDMKDFVEHSDEEDQVLKRVKNSLTSGAPKPEVMFLPTQVYSTQPPGALVELFRALKRNQILISLRHCGHGTISKERLEASIRKFGCTSWSYKNLIHYFTPGDFLKEYPKISFYFWFHRNGANHVWTSDFKKMAFSFNIEVLNRTPYSDGPMFCTCRNVEDDVHILCETDEVLETQHLMIDARSVLFRQDFEISCDQMSRIGLD